MHIQLEVNEQHAIQSYSDHNIQINSIIYTSSLIVSREKITSDLPIKSIQSINQDFLNALLQHTPEIIILGHGQPGAFPPTDIVSQLSKMRIGIECMSIGAACRTFNVLLGEGRKIVGGFIFL